MSRNKREGVFGGRLYYGVVRGHASGYQRPSSANARAVSVAKGNRWLDAQGLVQRTPQQVKDAYRERNRDD